MPAAVASRYARALAELATRAPAGVEPHRVLEELETVEAALAASAALRHVVLSPAVPAPQKRALIGKLAGRLGLSDLVRRFLLVVIDHRRAALLADIRQAFEALLDERLGLVRVDVTSARELTARQREAVTSGLARLTGKRPRPRFATDAGLIGGVVARVGSTVYDGSVRGQLGVLEKRLAGTRA
ncbi:MAG: ATP synthase F1 subunit delta [Acidobacteriota bacterium]